MDDFGYSSNLASEFGLQFTNHRLYSITATNDLGSDFVWVNTTSAFNFTSSQGTQTSVNPCIRDLDGDGVVDVLDEDSNDPEIGAQFVTIQTQAYVRIDSKVQIQQQINRDGIGHKTTAYN